MRRLILQMMVTLDGYYAGPSGEADWHVVDEDFNLYAAEFLSRVDTLLFGRVTYDMMASFWPTVEAKSNDPMTAAYMNGLQKVVVSRTLGQDRIGWDNVRVVNGNIAEEVASLKRRPGKDIAIFGSSVLAVDLVRAGLIDEFRIFLNPVALGAGKPLLAGLSEPLKLQLTESRAFRSGNVLLVYRAA